MVFRYSDLRIANLKQYLMELFDIFPAYKGVKLIPFFTGLVPKSKGSEEEADSDWE